MKTFLHLFALLTMSLLTSQTIDVCSPSYPDGVICKCTTTNYDCAARNISNLRGGYNISATKLDLSNNKITSVHVGPLNNLTNLMILNLAENSIETIEVGSFDGLTNLRNLVLRFNQLKTIERGVFRQLFSLEELHLDHNLVETIEAGSFDELGNLRQLDFSHNKITSVRVGLLNNLTNLESLYLVHDSIESIEVGTFDGLMSLRKLVLSSNVLKTIGRGVFRQLPSLKELDMEDNLIETIETGTFDELIDLRLLDFSNNSITSVHVGPLNNLTNLETLFLDVNCIETIEVGSFDGMMNLGILVLSSNVLKTIGRGVFRQLPLLKELYIERNLIEIIEAGSFDGLMNLSQLCLQDNKLTAIRRDIFRHLSSLTELDLSKNKITSINRYAFFTIPSLTTINLDNNPLNCSCEEYLLQEFLEMRKGGLYLTNKPCNAGQTPCPSGEALFNSPTFCYECQYAASFPECGKQGTTQCTGKNSVCYNLIEYSSGDLNISGGCEDFNSCLNYENQNRLTCFIGAGTKCFFCNPDSLSNARDETNTTNQFNATLQVNLEGQMTEQLQNTSSSVYENFTQTLETEVSKYIRGQKGRFDVKFIGLRPLLFRVRCSTMWFNNPEEVMVAVEHSLSNKTINGKNVTSLRMFRSEGGVPCPAETTEDPTYGKFKWPATNPGASSFLECPYQLYNLIAKSASRNCERQSDNSGLWKEPLLSNCPRADKTSRELQTLAESDINKGNVEEVSSNLSTLTSNWQSFSSAQITWSVGIIDRISNLSHVSPKSISTTLDTVNKLLFIKVDILQQAEIESKSSNRLLKGIQLLLDSVSLTGGDYQAVKENIAGIASAVSASSFKGFTMSYRNPGTKPLTNTKISYRKEDGTIEENHSGIVLPKLMFDTLSPEKRKSIDKITLLVLKDTRLFSSITQRNETKFIQNDDGDTIPAERKINSNIIGASVPAAPIKDLQTPVVVTLSHLYTGNNVSCVYWNVDNSSWSVNGCNVKKTTEDYTVCHCYHLTNFALLMDVYSTGASSLALSIISYVGCGLSLLGVLLTLITHLKFRKLRRGNPSKILMNLCLSIGFVDIVFLIGVQEYSGSSDFGCKVVAVLLHYFLLTSMCWMAVEAFYMYLTLVKVFDSHVSHFQLKSSLFGWCTPVLVIAITLGINKSDNYGLQPGGICWLDRVPFFAAFLAPVCLLLLVNTIIFLLVIRRILHRGTKKITKTDKSTTIVRLRGAVSVFVLLGLTWVFGVLAFDGIGEAFHYMFALLNSSQGFFIFVFYCVLKKEAQQSWGQVLPCLKFPYEKATSSNTQNKGDSSVAYSSKTTTFYVSSKDDASTADACKTTNLGLNESTSQASKAVENECKSSTGDSSTTHPSNTTKLDVISKERTGQDSKSVEDACKTNTESADQVSNYVEDEGIINTESADQVSNSVEDEGIIIAESKSQVSNSVVEEGKNSTESTSNDSKSMEEEHKNNTERTSQDSKSKEEERENNTESADQVSNSVEDGGIINAESTSQFSNSSDKKGKNNTEDSKTNDPNKNTTLTLNLKETTSQVSKSVEDERKHNTAFRGNWHVQVPSPKQKTSFV